uniref:Uncharacterized protein n=1 Tax=Romanomermis culicivorax TaxID=13658 RepID=A0A915L5A0_ROMCU
MGTTVFTAKKSINGKRSKDSRPETGSESLAVTPDNTQILRIILSSFTCVVLARAADEQCDRKQRKRDFTGHAASSGPCRSLLYVPNNIGYKNVVLARRNPEFRNLAYLSTIFVDAMNQTDSSINNAHLEADWAECDECDGWICGNCLVNDFDDEVDFVRQICLTRRED